MNGLVFLAFCVAAFVLGYLWVTHPDNLGGAE